VLSTIYIIFTTGYISEGEYARDLCEEALFLSRLLVKLRPNDAEIEGALALILFTHARRNARVSDAGVSLPIEEQNRDLWDSLKIKAAEQLLLTAINRLKPGPYQIKAAIADCHMSKTGPDWQQMHLLYQRLYQFEPTEVVALNWAVVISELGREREALIMIRKLSEKLADFQPFYATLAHILSKLGQTEEAKTAYAEAIKRTSNKANKQYLELKLLSISDRKE